ncbi:uncharacterized protein (DUF305 family) [Nakamurella sp. UYEF19]|uniref:DUF305 domain-containing protein n=1 Tax=Nakamurella sp. UYEF19 TaxID=1756392 RepID=UPI00339A8661
MTQTCTRMGALIAAAALSVVLAACGTTSTTAASAANTSASSTAAPATSSTAAATSTSGSVAMQPGADGPFKAADVTFAQQMLIHHQGAVAMADLAPTRASSTKVKALAAQIKAEQTPEIQQMTGWLAVWAPHPAMSGMSSSPDAMGGMAGMGSDTGSASASMPGMMTDAQMGQLTAATGAQFDKLFLQLMIVHHQGALTMAKTEKADGGNTAALALADSIMSSQSAEITTMQDLLKAL